MKKVSSLMILLLAGVMMFVSCSSPSSGSGSRPEPVPPKDNIKIGETTYEYTGEVQLMETAQTVTGSDDYNHQYTGAFPKGRTVTLSPFIMGKYEVTQELYQAVMTGKTEGGKTLAANPSWCTSTSSNYKNMLPGEEQKYRPVEGVTWYDACYFCNALSEKLGLTKAYKITVNEVSDGGNITDATVTPVTGANGYRLPTEAEWEYAARGGSKSTETQFKQFWSGATTTNYSASENSDINGVAWYYYNAYNLGSGNAGYGTHQVGKKDANAAGLCDMSGNVCEWCYDWHASISTKETVTDPSGPSEAQSCRVNRGGSWNYYAHYCAVSGRGNITPGGRDFILGFRVVRSAQ